jgi:hypothetical protein
MGQQYKPHAPGEAPDEGARDRNGVQKFTGAAGQAARKIRAAAEPECPGNMIFDPATGECIAPDREG